MRDEDKSKEQLLQELKELRRQSKKALSQGYPLFAPIMETDRAGQAADELEQSISLLQATLESTADGLLVIDSSGKITAYNQKFAQMWRIDESILEARDDDRALAFVLEQLKDPEGFISKVRELYGQPEAESYDLLEFKDGRFFERYSQPQRLGPTIVGRVWSFRDVTARMQARVALKESEEKYRRLVNQIPAVVFKGYPDWSVDFFDNKIETLTGYSKEEFDSRRISWKDVILPEDLDYATKIFIDAIKTDGSYMREHRIRRKDGEIRWVQCWGRISYDAASRIDYISGVTFDVTPRKQAEEALLKYKFIANAAKDCMTLIDRNYLYEAANAAYCQAHGKTLEEVVGISVASVWGQDTFEKAIKGYLDRCFTGQTVEFEGWFEFGKQGRGCYHVFYSPYFNAQGTVDYAAVVSHDITERKRAEEALRENEEHYRSLFDNMLNGLAYCQMIFEQNKPVDFIYLRVNSAFEVLTGLKEVTGKKVSAVIPGIRETDPELFEIYGRVALTGQPERFETYVEALDMWFSISAYSPQKEYFVAIFDVITERKQAEKALKESEEKYRKLMETASDAILIAEVDTGVIIDANQRAQELLGLPLEKIIGMHQGQLHPPAEAERYREIFRTHAEVGGIMDEEIFVVDSQGRRIPVEISAGNVELRGKRLIYGIFRDLTERRRAAEALRQSEEKYRLLVSQIPAVVYKGYTDWSLDCFDRKIEEITGYSMEEFNSRQKTWLDMILPEDIDQAKELFKEAQECDCSYVSEHRVRNKAGEIRWIQARNRIICDAAGKVDYISGVFFDITDRKELSDQLIKAQRMEAVGILAGGLAHDFNNLLTAIMGYGEIMMMDLRKEDPFSAYINEITKAASRGASLTNQLLAFSRKQILQPQVINLNEVVVDMDKMLRRLIGEDIDLVTFIDQELGLVKADPGQIEQIIMNLAVNARDALPDGGSLTLETANVYLDQAYARSHVSVTPGSYVMLAVSDDGVGMDTETVSHIFEPFFTTKESGKGTGLGLATVYGIVQQSGGNIWVYSEPGKGTTFKVYLPRVEAGALEPQPKAAAPAVLAGEETILLVEDDATLRDLVSTALRKYGFTVLEASHGGEALLICEREKAPIHLLLTDVVMPQISGGALAERLLLLHPEMKVLYMSGYTENAIVHHGVLDSGVKFIAKPFRLLGLLQKVREVLGSS